MDTPDIIAGLEELYNVIDSSDDWFAGSEENEQAHRATVSAALEVLRKQQANATQ